MFLERVKVAPIVPCGLAKPVQFYGAEEGGDGWLFMVLYCRVCKFKLHLNSLTHSLTPAAIVDIHS